MAILLDFLPAAHELKNTGDETLVILVMGQRLDQDVADYPDKNKRLYRNSGKWDLVEGFGRLGGYC